KEVCSCEDSTVAMALSLLTASSSASFKLPRTAVALISLTDGKVCSGLYDTHQVFNTGGLLFLLGLPLEKLRVTWFQSIPVCCDKLALYTKFIGFAISSTRIS